MEPLLTIKEVASHLKLTPQSIRARIKKDTEFASLFIKIGRGYRIKISLLSDYINKK
jgi:transcriptional antiterminator